LHQKAHGRTGPIKDAHEKYVQLAVGDDFDLMRLEIEDHMQRGVQQLENYVSL
jgi:hypothetical protein